MLHRGGRISLDHIWHHRGAAACVLWPISLLYSAVVALRRWMYGAGVLSVQHFDVPVIVVGNISVGGAGKTPIVSALARHLRSQGRHPGIVSRGYGGSARNWPLEVAPESSAKMAGDEPVMLARQTRCPVVVAPNRPSAVRHLLAHHACDVVVADDGLQHLALHRDIEIAVIDGERRFGNGFCLPAGPLREPPSRLNSVDFVIVQEEADGNDYGNTSFACRLVGSTAVSLANPEASRMLSDFRGQQVHAVAGIGNPDRFFRQLKNARLDVTEHAFDDHHRFQRSDFDFTLRGPILMTEKDAVKCTTFADLDMWYVPVQAELDAKFYNQLLERLRLDDR